MLRDPNKTCGNCACWREMKRQGAVVLTEPRQGGCRRFPPPLVAVWEPVPQMGPSGQVLGHQMVPRMDCAYPTTRSDMDCHEWQPGPQPHHTS